METDSKIIMYIGPNQIKEVKQTEEKTAGGFEIVEVYFDNGRKERFSKQMYDKIVSETSCDLSELRDKRIFPVTEVVLGVLRDWGIKVGELPYFSAVLNRSLDDNHFAAIKELWSKWMPRPLDPSDVDLITVDLVLKSSGKTLDDILKESN